MAATIPTIIDEYVEKMKHPALMAAKNKNIN
jgi:hypothetical protein